MFFSVIVPVYNRPVEVNELLESLCNQIYTHFEVLVVEDGSQQDCKAVVSRYHRKLDVRYYYKQNSGQGFSRNFGFEMAGGDYLVVFDSDCIIPPHYFQTVHDFLKTEQAEAWGGPDRAHPCFSPLQKAINYAMTSPLTTGGIRGRKKHIGTYHPRSFNMGISRTVYEKTGGYRITRMGEDLEFSIRIVKNGFKTRFVEDAYVYHKRRSNFRQFFHQLHYFGRARINILRYHPRQVKPVHCLPAFFNIALITSALFIAVEFSTFWPLLLPFLLFSLLLFAHSYYLEKNRKVAVLSVAASYIQLTAYGAGFLQELCRYFLKP